jgi:hypothetical protein
VPTSTAVPSNSPRQAETTTAEKSWHGNRVKARNGPRCPGLLDDKAGPPVFRYPHFSPAGAVSTTKYQQLLAPPVPRSRCKSLLMLVLKRLASGMRFCPGPTFRSCRAKPQAFIEIWPFESELVEHQALGLCTLSLFGLCFAAIVSRGLTGTIAQRQRHLRRGEHLLDSLHERSHEFTRKFGSIFRLDAR